MVRTESRLSLVWVFERRSLFFSFFTHCGCCLHHILNFRIVTAQERHLFCGKETEKNCLDAHGALLFYPPPSVAANLTLVIGWWCTGMESNSEPEWLSQSSPDRSDDQHWGPSSCSCGLFLIFHSCYWYQPIHLWPAAYKQLPLALISTAMNQHSLIATLVILTQWWQKSWPRINVPN